MDHVTRPELLSAGWTDRDIRSAIDSGRLERIRPGHFATSSLDARVREAVSLGGRLTCVSELRSRGIWVLDGGRLHIQVPATSARIRSDRALVHWRRLTVPTAADRDHVGVVDALLAASTCLDPFAWIASVDSAWHLGQIDRRDLDRLRAGAPRMRRHLGKVERNAASGIESIARMIALELGFRVRSQVHYRDIGFVDLVVEDWVVIETDGSEFHDAATAPRDRRRDAVAAGRGRVTLRPGYSLVVFRRATVARQIIESVAAHRRVKDAGRIAARARRRLAAADPSCIFDG